MVHISPNSLSGPIPNCPDKVPFDAHEKLLSFYSNGRKFQDESYMVELQVPFTTKWRSYTYKGRIVSYMSGLNLSHNNLNGSIPLELGNLMHIWAMNLSHNNLRGQIPTTLSNLKHTESLDLSFNNLSGEIPHQVIELTSLEIFNLAHNSLFGSTPNKNGQFLTSDESRYEENKVGSMDMEFFYIRFGVSYTSILLVIAAILYIDPQWQRAWFYFIEYVITYCYNYFHRWFANQHK
ncbi:hypothetical protein L6164_033432 [Bauhinia variegata]|uniref:Uncharacterized protein n=1 Tax=Bauhinia variegata TaxID=167791 RepID=A0ACB9KS10_BAUVA|nr:hypothetical protein L6164_033432 [Bauhinia variegata]